MLTSFDGHLAVVINSFNRVSLLKEALPSIERTLDKTLIESSIIIFEAGSTDGSMEFIDKYSVDSKIQIICISPPANYSNTFSGGCNFAIDFAAKKYKDLKWIFLYETDNFLSNQNAVSDALSIIDKKPNLGAIGFTVEKYDTSKVGYGQKFPTLLSFIMGQQLTAKLGLLDPKPTWIEENGYKWTYEDIVYTSPLLINFNAWKQTHGMDSTNFPFSDSDNDWCWRLLEKGWRCAVLDTNGVIHDNKSVTSSWSSKRTLDFHKARYRLLRKHKGIKVEIIKPLLIIRHIIESSILFLGFLGGKKKISNINVRLTLIKKVIHNYS